MSAAGGAGKPPAADKFHGNSSTPTTAVQGHLDVLIAKYGNGYRWWPAPESRRRGSQRWVVPAVEHWHPAASIAEIGTTFQARKTQP